MPKTCSWCGLVSPDEAARCDCGESLSRFPDSATPPVRIALGPQRWITQWAAGCAAVAFVFGILWAAERSAWAGHDWGADLMVALIFGTLCGCLLGALTWWLRGLLPRRPRPPIEGRRQASMETLADTQQREGIIK
jgi:hypothetical protein